MVPLPYTWTYAERSILGWLLQSFDYVYVYKNMFDILNIYVLTKKQSYSQEEDSEYEITTLKHNISIKHLGNKTGTLGEL